MTGRAGKPVSWRPRPVARTCAKIEIKTWAYPMHPLKLRSATLDDLALTYAITEEAMRAYVEATWGHWDEDEQREKHLRNFTPQTHQIIVVDGVEVGFVAIEDFPSYTWLVKLYLRRDSRNRGIGSALLKQFMQAAAAQNKPLRLQVLRVNALAQQLYFRHGFKIAHETAERLFLEIGA